MKEQIDFDRIIWASMYTCTSQDLKEKPIAEKNALYARTTMMSVGINSHLISSSLGIES